MATTRSRSFQQESAAYRAHLPDLSTPRFQAMRQQNAHEYARNFFENQQPPWLYGLSWEWKRLHGESYRGVTVDGNVIPDLYPVRDEGLPIDEIVTAAGTVLQECSSAQKRELMYPLDAPEWRAWSNPEILMSPNGLRLDEIDESLALAILNVLRVTLSPEGYEKALSAMRINHFLGELVKAPTIMNKYSYNFLLFGTPSTTEPWGFSFYGHHLCLNILLYQRQIVVAPFFTGAEPNLIDEGPWAGTRILYKEEEWGLELMRSLDLGMQKTAQIYEKMHDPAMPEGRWNKDDQRHLCGAFRDNRVVPYEGVKVSELSSYQRQLILAILEQNLLYLPLTSRKLQLETIQSHFRETFFSWIGGFELDDPFYFRIQSPVVIAEFDHHSGVFLTNGEPAKFHIHTILRYPNAGDYGRAIWRGLEGDGGREGKGRKKGVVLGLKDRGE